MEVPPRAGASLGPRVGRRRRRRGRGQRHVDIAPASSTDTVTPVDTSCPPAGSSFADGMEEQRRQQSDVLDCPVAMGMSQLLEHNRELCGGASPGALDGQLYAREDGNRVPAAPCIERAGDAADVAAGTTAPAAAFDIFDENDVCNFAVQAEAPFLHQTSQMPTRRLWRWRRRRFVMPVCKYGRGFILPPCSVSCSAFLPLCRRTLNHQPSSAGTASMKPTTFAGATPSSSSVLTSCAATSPSSAHIYLLATPLVALQSTPAILRRFSLLAASTLRTC